MPLPAAALQAIVARCTQRWDRHYVPAKLRSDPVYAAVASELRGSDLPILDIGCGLGLLTHYLRAIGHHVAMTGFDNDERKIASAQAMAAGMDDVSFAIGDARCKMPPRQGHVVILDILQFFRPEEQNALLQQAAQRLAPGAKLIIRSGLCDATWRYRITVVGDWLARLTFWMKSHPLSYPTSEQFHQVLQAAGLQVCLRPLWGNTPFNNHLIVAQR